MVPFNAHQSRYAQPLLLLPWVLSLLLAGCTLVTAEEVEEKVVVVGQGTTVEVETRNGRIAVHEGREGKVTIKATKRVRAVKDAKDLIKEIKVVVKTRDKTLQVGAEHPSGKLTKQYTVSFEVGVPPGTAVLLKSQNGAIRLAGALGPVTATTRNGSITGDAGKGPVMVNTANGSIKLGGLSSHFEARTHNGSVQLRLADQVALTGVCVAETRNGSITVSAPETLSASVVARTKNGKVRSDFALSTQNRGYAAGKIGAGSAELRLESRNGSIRLEKRRGAVSP